MDPSCSLAVPTTVGTILKLEWNISMWAIPVEEQLQTDGVGGSPKLFLSSFFIHFIHRFYSRNGEYWRKLISGRFYVMFNLWNLSLPFEKGVTFCGWGVLDSHWIVSHRFSTHSYMLLHTEGEAEHCHFCMCAQCTHPLPCWNWTFSLFQPWVISFNNSTFS